MEPKSIADLPIDHNQRWAKDQENLAQAPHIKEDRFIVGPASVDVTEPSYASALKALVGQDQTNLQWAIIEPPAIRGARRTDLFGNDGLIPRLGNAEKLQVLKERLQSLPEIPGGT